nr:S-layer homology domain-containing protein [uncultured Anaerotignum sp.]
MGDLITREQFAAILYRYAQFKGYDVSVGADTNILSYADALIISEYAYPAMQWACGAGIMGGMDDGTLMPQGKATRAEAATMLMNFCEKIVK